MQITDQLSAAREGNPGPKLRLFSGHDTTILPFLRILQQDFSTWPPFVANIVFELWQKQDGGEAVVRALYNGQPIIVDGSGKLRLVVSC